MSIYIRSCGVSKLEDVWDMRTNGFNDMKILILDIGVKMMSGNISHFVKL